MIGLDLMGADKMTQAEQDHAPSAWLTDEQLANVNRALTPEEQKRVDAYQEKQSNTAQATEEKKGGPTATMTVTPAGATLISVVPKTAAPHWEIIATIAAVVAALGLLVDVVLKHRKKKAS